MRSSPRSRVELAVVALALLSSTSCTLVAGAPWGEASLSARVAFAPPASRLTNDGALKTSKDYAVALSRFDLVVREVDLRVREGGGEALSFDPANPPPGYSLCHNGHCHADDGRLVDYEDIEIELAGGSGAALSFVYRPVVDESVALTAGSDVALSLGACSDGCTLPRGALVSSGMSLDALVIEGHVVDLRPSETARLHEDGVAFSVRVPLDTRLEALVEGTIDDASGGVVEVALALSLTPSLFDDVDFGGVLGSAARDELVALDDVLSVTEGISLALLDESALTAAVDLAVEPSILERDVVLWNP